MTRRPWTLEHHTKGLGTTPGTYDSGEWMHWGSYASEKNAQHAIDRECKAYGEHERARFRITPPTCT